MKLPNIAFTLGFLTASAALAQGPMYDKIIVNLPYTVTVRDAVLPPGEYEIRQDPSPSNNRILRFYSDKGMKFETTAMAIPALDNRTPEGTSLMLDKYGPDYYLNKIWVQGKNYGYEFPIPDAVKSREKERNATSVSARYEPSPAQEIPVAAAAPVVETADNNPPPPPARVDAQPAREPESVTAAQPFELAQNTPPPPPVAAAPAAPPSSADTTTPPMPATSANWLNFMLGGGALTGIGLMLCRARA